MLSQTLTYSQDVFLPLYQWPLGLAPVPPWLWTGLRTYLLSEDEWMNYTKTSSIVTFSSCVCRFLSRAKFHQEPFYFSRVPCRTQSRISSKKPLMFQGFNLQPPRTFLHFSGFIEIPENKILYLSVGSVKNHNLFIGSGKTSFVAVAVLSYVPEDSCMNSWYLLQLKHFNIWGWEPHNTWFYLRNSGGWIKRVLTPLKSSQMVLGRTSAPCEEPWNLYV